MMTKYSHTNYEWFLKIIQPAWGGLDNFHIIIYTFLYMMITKYFHTSCDWTQWIFKIYSAWWFLGVSTLAIINFRNLSYYSRMHLYLYSSSRDYHPLFVYANTPFHLCVIWSHRSNSTY